MLPGTDLIDAPRSCWLASRSPITVTMNAAVKHWRRKAVQHTLAACQRQSNYVAWLVSLPTLYSAFVRKNELRRQCEEKMTTGL